MKMGDNGKSESTGLNAQGDGIKKSQKVLKETFDKHCQIGFNMSKFSLFNHVMGALASFRNFRTLYERPLERFMKHINPTCRSTLSHERLKGKELLR